MLTGREIFELCELPQAMKGQLEELGIMLGIAGPLQFNLWVAWCPQLLLRLFYLVAYSLFGIWGEASEVNNIHAL